MGASITNPHLKATCRIAAALVGLSGVIVLLGWSLKKPLLRAEWSGIGVKSNTAVCFLLAGIALWLHSSGAAATRRVQVARGLALGVLLIGVLTIGEHVTGRNFGIDELLFREPPGEVATTSPNRMGPPASTCFVLSAVALLLLNVRGPRARRMTNAASSLAIAVAVVSSLPALGYLYGAAELYGVARLTGIALATALSFIALSTGILCAGPEGQVVSLITAPTAGGVLVRRLLWPAIFLPPLLGYIRTLGETAGYYDAPLGRALLVISFVLLFAGLVWLSGRVLETADLARSHASERLGAIVESSDDAIVGKTLEGIVTSWNRGAERLFGYTAEEMMGQNILRVVPPERHPEEPQIIARLRAGKSIEHFETVRITKDNRRIDISLTISPIRDATGKIIGASKIARDISDLKKRDRQRDELLAAEHAARNASEQAGRMKDEFLATLSHELRTPLNAILGWSQLLRRENLDPDDVRSGLDTIERNARVQTQLIDDLLDMSRIISGKVRLDIQPVEPISFIEAAIETVRPSADAKGIRLEKLLDPAAGPISGDPNRLQQVIWNLLSNAIKFTPRGGKVQVLLQRVNSHIEISVADTGMGISPEFLSHAFERFRQADASTTRKYGGLGLGLAIVKHLVELHGGVVRAHSPGEDKGTTFTVHLPLTAVHRDTEDVDRHHPQATKSASREFNTYNLSGVKVLVVDDEPDACDLIRRVLQECGASVVTTRVPADAVGLVEKELPHVLVSDIGMPDIDGYELLKRIRALGREKGGRVPAIALTAFARSEDRTRALRAGFAVHVSKPVEPSELAATVASVAGRMGSIEASG